MKKKTLSPLTHEKEIVEYEKSLEELKKQNQKSSLWSKKDLHSLESKLETLKKKVYSQLSPWERVAISRHPARPHSSDYIEQISDEFVEIFGDRTFQDDHAMITGMGKISDKKFVFIGLEKGKDTESRIYRNFGMAHPEGYRKALRAMKLAEKFHLPIVSFIDTPGA